MYTTWIASFLDVSLRTRLRVATTSAGSSHGCICQLHRRLANLRLVSNRSATLPCTSAELSDCQLCCVGIGSQPAKSMMHPHGYESACLQCHCVRKSGHLYVWSPCKGLALRTCRPARHCATATGDSRRKATQQHGTASGTTPRLSLAAEDFTNVRPPSQLCGCILLPLLHVLP
jgi:hypothetical protein